MARETAKVPAAEPAPDEGPPAAASVEPPREESPPPRESETEEREVAPLEDLPAVPLKRRPLSRHERSVRRRGAGRTRAAGYAGLRAWNATFVKENGKDPSASVAPIRSSTIRRL